MDFWTRTAWCAARIFPPSGKFGGPTKAVRRLPPPLPFSPIDSVIFSLRLRWRGLTRWFVVVGVIVLIAFAPSLSCFIFFFFAFRAGPYYVDHIKSVDAALLSDCVRVRCCLIACVCLSVCLSVCVSMCLCGARRIRAHANHTASATPSGARITAN